MSLLSGLLKKIVPPSVAESPVAMVGEAVFDQYVGLAKSGGRAAVVRAATTPLATLQRIAPHADPVTLQADDAALAAAAANLAMALAGVPE